MFIFSGSSNKSLTAKIASTCNAIVGEVTSEVFPNGERRIQVLSDVRGHHVVLVQSFSDPVDSHIIEFLMIADALERAGSKRVIAIIPWMGYSLQDKVFRDGEAMGARVVADLVSHAFTDRVLLLDLHNSSITGFFSVPSHHVRALPLFAQFAQEHFKMSDVMVVSPDFGGIKPARVYADALKVNLANIDKHRDLNTGEITPMGISGGHVKGKICLVYDDVINTGGTVVEVAKYLKEHDAKEVHFLVTHGLFAGTGLKKMEDDAIDSVVITDSVEHKKLPAKIKVLTTAELFAKDLQQ